jgi:hypothetical protein
MIKAVRRGLPKSGVAQVFNVSRRALYKVF